MMIPPRSQLTLASHDYNSHCLPDFLPVTGRALEYRMTNFSKRA